METYDDIIEEIERLDVIGENYKRYLNNHGLRKQHQWASTDMALDIAKRVRDAVAGDPSEWWVPDSHGERIHIGDTYSPINGKYDKAYMLGDGIVRGLDQVTSNSGACLKHIPDTREKVIEDLTGALELAQYSHDGHDHRALELAAKFFDRITDLVKEER